MTAPTEDEILAGVREYGDAREALGKSAGAASRQAEVDTLTGNLHDANDANDIAKLRIANLGVDLEHAQTDLAAALKQIAELENPTPVVHTQAGACSATGGTGLPVYNAIAAKWGEGVTARIFNTDGRLVFQATHPLGRIHNSFKPSVADFMNNVPAALAVVDAAVDAAKPGDVIDAWHEFDVKEKQGTAPCTFAQYVAFKNKLHARIKARRPEILTAVTVSIARFVTTKGVVSTENMDRWKAIDADVFGVDFDGGRDLTFYPVWDAAPAIIHDWCAGEFASWAIPELNHPRNTADTDGSGRAAWLQRMAQAAADASCLYVHLFDYDSTPNQVLSKPKEIAGWLPVIARNAS